MAPIKTGPATPGMHWLAIPAAVSIIVVLGYSSQWLFYTATDLDPGPLTTKETYLFNGLLLCLWWTYLRACTVDPGRYEFESLGFDGTGTAQPTSRPSSSGSSSAADANDGLLLSSEDGANPVRWCKKCNAPKPARAHHCKHCRRCIPKMDHHCPWTGNCVSLQTFPHFVRFVVFTNLSLWMCGYLLALRFWGLWANRELPAYLGPTLGQLIHLALLGLLCFSTSLALGIMMYTTGHAWVMNMTMIESWEMDRQEALLERYSRTSPDGTWWAGDDEEDDDDDDDDAYYNNGSEEDEDEDDGEEDEEDNKASTYSNGSPKSNRVSRAAAVLRDKVEFPYDIGFYANMAQAMGTANPLLWLFPLAGGPRIQKNGSKGIGWEWPENGFNSREGMWPPPDPEKQRQAARNRWASNNGGDGAEGTNAAFTSGREAYLSPEEEKAAFKARQEADFRRRRGAGGGGAVGGGGYGSSGFGGGDFPRLHPNSADDVFVDKYRDSDSDGFEQGMDGKRGWMNADGDRLRDYGVDEEADNDDEDVPLGELLRKRAGAAGKAGKAMKSQ